jgi:hypothetical protein
MKATEAWIDDWRIGISPAREGEIGRELIAIFQRFWEWADLDKKAKSTRQRYSGLYMRLVAGLSRRSSRITHQ